ncbi:MAG: membrane protein insertase YidC [Verrucomicrobiia bacterium]
MDRKSLIILVASFALLMLWYPLTNKLFPPLPLPPQSTNLVSTNIPLAGTNATTAEAPDQPALRPAPTLPTPRSTARDASERTLVIENSDVRYTFTSHGGGLKFVELKAYPAVVECRKRSTADQRLAMLNAPPPVLPVLSIVGGESVQGDGVFNLTRARDGVRAEKTLPNGLRLVKEFHPSTNFLLRAVVRLENHSGQALALPAQEWVVGTATPMGLRDESYMMGLEWYDGSDSQKIDAGWFANRTLGCIPGTPRSQFVGGSSNVVWAAVHNQFFAVITVPGQPAPAVSGRQIQLPGPTPEQLSADSKAIPNPTGYEAALVYPPLVLTTNEVVERTFDVYAGPKEYNTLARLPNDQDLVMGFGGFFGFFAKALLLSMNGLHTMALPYGIAIIVITVIIKLLFWPLTNASTRSMKRMQELQPQMKALQEKYKDDPRKMNMKLMEFMRANKVSPLGGCLPMLLQIPVFFGFYRMLQSAIELRGAQFLWACDLSQPDTIWVIPGLNFPLNPLPLLMGATMLWQARLTPVSPGMDPVQQKLMKYMPLIFMVFLYSFSAGLTLYWTVQNLLTIAQMKLTRTKPASSPTPQMTPGIAGKRATPKKKR